MGPAVADLHRRLRGLGVAAGPDPRTFSEKTASGVRDFQERRGLRVDGVCGRETWDALVEAGYRIGDRLLYLRQPMLRGDDIVEVQRQLGALGFHVGRADGIFGPGTHQAVQAFQRNTGLTPDGTVGLATVFALRRLRSRGPAGDPAALRETARLQAMRPSMREHHVVVAEVGGLGALARETQRAVSARGGRVTLLAHPDAGALAEQANNTGASLCVGLALAASAGGCRAAYWGAHESESPAGRRIATLVLEELSSSGAGVDGGPRAMNTSFLRATRMPAVLVDIGPARFAVERGADAAAAIGRAVERWADNPGGL